MIDKVKDVVISGAFLLVLNLTMFILFILWWLKIGLKQQTFYLSKSIARTFLSNNS